MAGEITPDDLVPDLLPALREFVDAVNDRDYDTMQAALLHTPPITLAILAAGWVGDLQNETVALRKQVKREKAAAFESEAVANRHEATLLAVRRAYGRQEAELSDALKTITRLQGDLYIAKQRKECE